MAKKLYVGSLAYATTNESLKAAFSQAGNVVEAVVMMDKMAPDRSRGFGFVTMANADEAKKAIEMWDGKELDGRRIKVNEARPREDRPMRRM